MPFKRAMHIFIKDYLYLMKKKKNAFYHIQSKMISLTNFRMVNFSFVILFSKALFYDKQNIGDFPSNISKNL